MPTTDRFIDLAARASFARFACWAATCLVASTTASQAAPVISPFADDLPGASYSADTAAGGSSAESVFNGGYWNAGSHGTHWVQADMGQVQTLSRVTLTVDVLPTTNTWQQVYLSDTPIGNGWSALTPVAELASHWTLKYDQFVLDFAPASGRYLQVVSNGGGSWTALGDGAGRSDWVDPAATGGTAGGTPLAGTVPEPGSGVLVLSALLAMAQLRRRVRQAQ